MSTLPPYSAAGVERTAVSSSGDTTGSREWTDR